MTDKERIDWLANRLHWNRVGNIGNYQYPDEIWYALNSFNAILKTPGTNPSENFRETIDEAIKQDLENDHEYDIPF